MSLGHCLLPRRMIHPKHQHNHDFFISSLQSVFTCIEDVGSSLNRQFALRVACFLTFEAIKRGSVNEGALNLAVLHKHISNPRVLLEASLKGCRNNRAMMLSPCGVLEEAILSASCNAPSISANTTSSDKFGLVLNKVAKSISGRSVVPMGTGIAMYCLNCSYDPSDFPSLCSH